MENNEGIFEGLEQKDIEYTHPALSVIDSNIDQINALNNGFRELSDKLRQSDLDTQKKQELFDQLQHFYSDNLGFLADGLVEAGNFDLQPLDLGMIWSKLIEVFPDQASYHLAGIVGGVYAVQGLEDSRWKKFPSYFTKTGEIPVELKDDKTSLEHITVRIDDNLRGVLDDLRVNENVQNRVQKQRPGISRNEAWTSIDERFKNGTTPILREARTALRTVTK